jgi:methylenetetrahydrofolate--tRNA-(uracil-5-)-methyltransferase
LAKGRQQNNAEGDRRGALLDERVTVIGGGLAGSEAAWQLAIRGVPVTLVEMRPGIPSPAHHTAELAELVCSNSFKGTDTDTATGLLKSELARMGSLVLAAARRTAVPAGSALAVDRTRFARLVTATIEGHPLVQLVRVEATELPRGRAIIATGPLTSPSFETALADLVGTQRLAFFDAAAPILDAESIDMARVFEASRWGRGSGADYLNAPLDRSEYEALVRALTNAQRVRAHDFEGRQLFSACQPVEEIARTGQDALRFGPLKPVGLAHPTTGTRPWAVVQLRAENAERTAFNMVGFQTNLTFAEQKRVFRLVPGLQAAEFLRYGVMHRNTFIDAPRLLDDTLALRADRRVRFAGQITGTEGYLEAAATGLLAAANTYADIRELRALVLPRETALGSLISYATSPETADYQPMHVNFGLLPPLAERTRGRRERYAAYAARAREALDSALAARPDLLFVDVRAAADEVPQADGPEHGRLAQRPPEAPL